MHNLTANDNSLSVDHTTLFLLKFEAIIMYIIQIQRVVKLNNLKDSNVPYMRKPPQVNTPLCEHYC